MWQLSPASSTYWKVLIYCSITTMIYAMQKTPGQKWFNYMQTINFSCIQGLQLKHKLIWFCCGSVALIQVLFHLAVAKCMCIIIKHLDFTVAPKRCLETLTTLKRVWKSLCCMYNIKASCIYFLERYNPFNVSFHVNF